MSRVRAEIDEQPEVLTRVLDRNREAVADAAAAVERAGPRFVVIAARGSSDNAARYAQHVFGRFNRLPVALATPSLHTTYGAPPRFDSALVLGISQSGASPDVVAVLRDGREQGQVTVAVTNDPSSPLADAAEHVVPLHAGREQALAATKTYTASLCAVADLAVAMAGDGALRRELAAVPEALQRQIALTGDAAEAVEEAAGWDRCVVVGRGPNYATAHEAALKLKEMTGVAADPYSPADLRHGPVVLVEDGYPVLGFASSGPAFVAVEAVLDEVRRRGARLTLVSDDPAAALEGDLLLPAVPVPEWLSPMVTVVPAQILAAEAGERKGISVDAPPGLTKVTRTR